jgi:hypothetical protein
MGYRTNSLFFYSLRPDSSCSFYSIKNIYGLVVRPGQIRVKEEALRLRVRLGLGLADPCRSV